jgi:hypothetical protein
MTGKFTYKGGQQSTEILLRSLTEYGKRRELRKISRGWGEGFARQPRI